MGLGELVLKCRLQIVNACQRKVAHTKKTFSSIFRGKFAGIRMPSGLPDDLADLPADIQNYMSVENTTSEISNLVLALLATLALSTFHPAHIRRKLAELNIYLTEDEIENYKEARTKKLDSKRKLRGKEGTS